MTALGPGQNLKHAFNRMELPLKQREPFDAFYVPRPAGCVDRLIEMFRVSDDCLKVLYSGYARTGKSTELFRLMFAVADDFLVAYVSADECLERSDIQHVDVLFALCTALARDAASAGVNLDGAVVNNIGDWTDQLRGEVERVQSTQRDSTMEASAGLSSFFAQALTRFRIEYSARQQIRNKLEPRVQEVIATIELISSSCLEQIGKRPLLILDDVEKVDRAVAEALFTHRTTSLQSIPCDVIYTIPVSLLNSTAMQPYQRSFKQQVILPMISVTTRTGEPDEEGIDTICDIITERASADLFADNTLRSIALWTGGVVADALRVARNACLAALTSDTDTVTPDMVDEAAGDLVLNYKRGLEEKSYPILADIARTNKSGVSDEHRELMHALAILEYENEPNWFDVHPAVRKLLWHRGDIAGS